MRIGGSNAGYAMFRGRVKGTGYPLHSPASPSRPCPCVTVCHHISTGLYILIQSVVADYRTYFSFRISLTPEAMRFGTDDCRCGIRVPDFSSKAARNPSHFGYLGVGILVRCETALNRLSLMPSGNTAKWIRLAH